METVWTGLSFSRDAPDRILFFHVVRTIVLIAFSREAVVAIAPAAHVHESVLGRDKTRVVSLTNSTLRLFDIRTFPKFRVEQGTITLLYPISRYSRVPSRYASHKCGVLIVIVPFFEGLQM